ncbi:MAG: hypothetical protein H0A76_07055 [Candidatus Thiodubiliella endoseptemdiera]|uniref:Uncharacterized protein n=1 Tax=Candidatus Thiodubiliella endoseptemdiera TaxID=2738886 RepID=A0A853F7G9_9GAMM|nr:hypothetical protein [Candidatus Thiodubiliella endoseptemdiera]
MAKFSESTLSAWSRAASTSEKSKRISRAISMIKDAINNSDQLSTKDIKFLYKVRMPITQMLGLIVI